MLHTKTMARLSFTAMATGDAMDNEVNNSYGILVIIPAKNSSMKFYDKQN